MTVTETSTTGDGGQLDAERFTGSAMEPTGITIEAPVRVPVERYLSPEFAALEHQKLWPKVWVIACTVDHVAHPGDFFELRLGWDSILIVRGDDGTLRAFQNACRHRGAQLLDGKRATTHWYFVDELLDKHPAIHYVADRRIVADRGAATTTGISASMPLALTLIEAIAGRTMAEAVGRDIGLGRWDASHDSGAFRFTRPFGMEI